MNEKLRECPFCGSKADSWAEFDIDRVGCSNDCCIAYSWPDGVDPVTWNTRHQPTHETVQQWEERTGQTYPDDGPVWSSYKDLLREPIKIEWRLELWKCVKEWEWDSPCLSIVATHHGKPNE